MTPSPGINIAQTDVERNAIYSFRYKVYIEEMGKPYSEADHETKRLSDPLDENATLLYCSSGDEIVGTLRINWGEDPSAYRAFTKLCNLEKFQCFPANCLSFCSRLMVHREHRYSATAGALSIAAYEIGARRDTQFNFAHCAPKLVKLFERMGFRQYRHAFFDAAAGTQVPLVLVMEDIEHLRAARSPFLSKASKQPGDSYAAAWFAGQFPATRKTYPGIKETINDYAIDQFSAPGPTA